MQIISPHDPLPDRHGRHRSRPIKRPGKLRLWVSRRRVWYRRNRGHILDIAWTLTVLWIGIVIGATVVLGMQGRPYPWEHQAPQPRPVVPAPSITPTTPSDWTSVAPIPPATPR